MAGPVVEFTEEGRCKLARVVAIFHWVCILPSLFCFLSALVIQLTIQDKVSFIENYNGAALPGILVFTGSFGFFLHILAGKAAFSNRQVEKREKWQVYLIPAAVLTLILFVFELTSGIMTLVHCDELEDAFDQGIRSAMNTYKSDVTVKEEVDVLQMTLKCCGSRSYKDWFSASWIHPNYMEKSARKKYYLKNDDVPFSCCNPVSMRPCIFMNVHENGRHYNYDYRSSLTLYKDGCTDILMAYYKDSILVVIGVIVLLLSFVQIALSLATRILQTAVLTASENDDEEGPSIGYLITRPDYGAPNETMTTEYSTGVELLDTTGEFEDERYVALNLDSVAAEPHYENVAPFGLRVAPAEVDPGPEVTDAKVEEYLSQRFRKSFEMLEQPPPPEDYEYAEIPDQYVLPDPPIITRRPMLTEVRSHHGSYMAMDMSNSSKARPGRSSLSPKIHRHLFPSPVRWGGTDGNTLVIDLNRMHVSEQPSGQKERTSQGRTKSIRSIEKYGLISQQRRADESVQSTEILPNRSNHARYTTPVQKPDHSARSCSTERCPCGHDTAPFLSPIRRKSPTKPPSSYLSPSPIRQQSKRSPNKYMTSSPVKTKFKSGVSKNCNHGID